MPSQPTVVTDQTPPGEPGEISLDSLLLDPDNPRLSAAGRTTDQAELIRRLWAEMAVDEIAYSIAFNGFYRQEALLVTVEGAPPGKFIVIEGNRRLAAVKVLCEDTLREKLR